MSIETTTFKNTKESPFYVSGRTYAPSNQVDFTYQQLRKPPIPPTKKIIKTTEESDFVGPPRPPELVSPVKPEKPKYSDAPGLKETLQKSSSFINRTTSAILPSKEFLQGFIGEAKQRAKDISSAFVTAGKVVTDKETRQDLKAGYQMVNEYIEREKPVQKFFIKSTRALQEDPRKNISTIVDVAKPIVADVVTKASTAKGRGSLGFSVAEWLIPVGLQKGAKLGDKLIRRQIIKMGATEVPATKLFSPQLFNKEGVLNTQGLAITDDVSKIKKMFEKTKGAVKEYPESYVLQSSLQDPFKGDKILTQAEKKALNIKTRGYDDPGFFGSPMGEGGTYYLRLADDTAQSSYKFSLFPELQKTGKPDVTFFLTKRVESYPQSILAKDKGFDVITQFQKELAQTKPSTILIPKRSETLIGSAKTRQLIKQADPFAIGTSEAQGIISAGVFVEPASAIKPRNWFSKLKGYSEFTKVGSEYIPLRYKLVSEADNVLDKFMGKISSVKTSISNEFKKQADDFYSYYTSSKKPTYTITPPYTSYLPQSTNYSISSLTDNDSYNYPPKPEVNTYIDPIPPIVDPTPIYTPDDEESKYYKKTTTTTNDYTYPIPPKPRDYPIYDPTYPKAPTMKYTIPGITSTDSLMPRRLKDRSYSYKDTSSKPNINQSFDVFVRTKGKWTQVDSKDPMNYYYAKQKGFDVADKYAERSVKLRPSKKPAKLISYDEPFNAYKFNWDKSKKETLQKSFIEKSSYAIDTIGELRGITYKGIKARSKNKFIF